MSFLAFLIFYDFPETSKINARAILVNVAPAQGKPSYSPQGTMQLADAFL